MGYMRHHAIIVTTYDDKILAAAHKTAITIFGDEQVSDPIQGKVNGYMSFLVGPDGSNEGWEPSDTGDARRKEFVVYLRAQAYSDGSSSLKWVEVQYGDDENQTEIVNDSDSDFVDHQAAHPEE